MSVKKILVVGPSWIGDMVMAQSLFKTMRAQQPQVVIDVLAPAWCFPLLQRMPEVDRAIEMPTKHGELALKKRWDLGKQLRQREYAQAVVLPNSFKSALLPWFAHIPVRTGWLGEQRYGVLNDHRRLNKKALPYMVQRFVALASDARADVPALADIPVPELVTANDQVMQTRIAFDLNLERHVLALCPGAEFGSSKRWPPEYYARVAQEYIASHGQVWLFGSKNDQAVCQQVLGYMSEHQVKHAHVLAGKTNLEQAVDLLSLADVVVSNDSGLMHIAAALNKPLVAIYGSTSAQFTPPLIAQERHVLASVNVDCGPCFKRECPNQASNRLRCLTEVRPEIVVGHIKQLSSLRRVSITDVMV